MDTQTLPEWTATNRMISLPGGLVFVSMIGFLVYQADWEAVAKIWGPLGVICFLLVLAIWKLLVPYIKQQADDNKQTLLSVVEDARKERDYMRVLREREVDKFLESSQKQAEIFKSSLQEAVRAIQDSKK